MYARIIYQWAYLAFSRIQARWTDSLIDVSANAQNYVHTRGRININARVTQLARFHGFYGGGGGGGSSVVVVVVVVP